MIWSVCFYVAIFVLVMAGIWAVYIKKSDYKKGRIVTPFNLLFGGVAIASFIMFIPIYAKMFAEERFNVGKMFLLAVHNTIRLFMVDGEFAIISENLSNISGVLADVYAMLAAILFVLAPFLTFGFVLSFFKNVLAYKNYYKGYFRDTYIFSELNEKSLALAKSLKKNNRKRSIVFTDVFETNEELMYELIEEANELGAILFKKDIAVINFYFHSRKSKIEFFIIGKDDDENVKQTLSLMSKYGERDNVFLYVFSTSANSELLLNNLWNSKMKIRRINEVQSLVYRHLYDTGEELFQKAIVKNEKKLISVVIAGMGQYGIEMVKALSWFCQMEDYELRINAFDKQKSAESYLSYECPELMDEKHNHDFATKGEAHYSITVHSGIDVESKEFLACIDELENVSYAFVALGEDEKNIRAAVKLRTWFLKSGNTPKIDAIVENSDKKDALSGVTNYSGQKYVINYIGDVRNSYSEEVIFESDIEIIALQRHLKWGEEESFWKYEYNYRSSVASAIHRKMKIACKIPGVDKMPKDRSEEERRCLRELEHRRWNAYMRSEGYTYAPERNNLAKTHHCLVPFEELSLKDQEKDDD